MAADLNPNSKFCGLVKTCRKIAAAINEAVNMKLVARFWIVTVSVLKIIAFSLGIVTKLAAAESDTINREFQLKTAYLFHIAELTEWPTSGSVTICLQGDSPVRMYLPALNGQSINDQPVHINLESQIDIASCRILFISNTADLNSSLREQAKFRHILLVSDVDGFAFKGGMLQLALRENKIKIIINLSAVKQAGLKLSSKLLRMAEILE
jgi:hypothetical protein